MHGNTSMNLLNNWNVFIEKIVPYMRDEASIKDKWSISLLESLNQDLNTSINYYYIIFKRINNL